METYDPNVASLIAPIQTVEEELARQPKPETSTVPSGLIRHEKNVDTEQMAEFATSIDEIMPGPSGMIQDEVMGPPMPVQGNKKTSRKSEEGSGKAAPFGLTEEQYDFLKPRLHNVFDFGSSRTKLYREFNKKFGKDLIEREKEIIEEEMRKTYVPRRGCAN